MNDRTPSDNLAPLVAGGQGRDAGDVERTARAFAWLMLAGALLAVIAAGRAVL